MNNTNGLTCPECSGVVPIKEGDRLVACPYCGLHSLIQGEQGVRYWQVARRVERDAARSSAKAFFSGIKKASDLRKEAEITDTFLAYLPYWRVHADVAGWRFGRERRGEDDTRPVEVQIAEEMHWNDAALDVSEYGVHQIVLSKEQILPYDKAALHAEAIVFEPTESHTDALKEARDYFMYRARAKKSLDSTFFEKFHFLHERLSIVYYPLWIVRYSYRQRHYQIVVDGVTKEILYGKAPGNIAYRAGTLIAGLASGNFILVNGTGLLLTAMSDSDDGIAMLLLPIVLGFGLIVWGYRSFRYGEEVEESHHKVRKALGQGGGLLGSLTGGNSNIDMRGLMKTGMSLLEDMAEQQSRMK